MKTKRVLLILASAPVLASCSFINNIKEKIFPSKEEKPQRVEITDKEERRKAVSEIKTAISKTLTANSFKLTFAIPALQDMQIEISIDNVQKNYFADGYSNGEKQNSAYGEMYEGKLAIYNRNKEDNTWKCVEYEKEQFVMDSILDLGLQSSSMEDELSETIRLYKEGDLYIQELGGTKDALIEAYKVSPDYEEKIAPLVDSLEDFQLIIGLKDGYYVYEEYKVCYLNTEYENQELVSVKAEKTSLYVGSFTEINGISLQRPEGVIVPPKVENNEPKTESADDDGNSSGGSPTGGDSASEGGAMHQTPSDGTLDSDGAAKN